MSGDQPVSFVEVYGGTHSPWVQSVLLGLEERGVDHSLRSTPPLECFKKWGVLMPAVSIDGAPWQIESSEILAELGFDPISQEDLNMVRAAWQGVLHRPNNPLRFFLNSVKPETLPRTLFIAQHATSCAPLFLFTCSY